MTTMGTTDGEPAQRAGDHEATEQSLYTYQEAVAKGEYRRDTGGLVGKFDNVRRYWENELTGQAIRDYLDSLVVEKKRRLERLRVLDLGCGSGEGYELLTNTRRRTSGVQTTNSLLVTPDLMGVYLGVDISPAMVAQGRASYRDNPKVAFEEGDLREGLPGAVGLDPFDLYFSSFGSLSHLNDQEMERLLVEIARHGGERALVVLDVLGRYSYEWQPQWDASPEGGMREYSMAYLGFDGTLDSGQSECFQMRYWDRRGLESLLERVAKASARKVSLLSSFDRSMLVGRHMDTGLYNPAAPPLRRVVNMLHESYHRTDLRELIFDYLPRKGFDDINRHLARLQMAWNAVVFYCIDRLGSDEMDPENVAPDAFPEPVRSAVKTLERVIDNVSWMRMGDPRANIIEPQLAYALRRIEVEMQRGEGCGHGLIGVVEVSG